MPQDPPDNGLDPNEQPTQPLPEVAPETVAADPAAGSGADAPTVAFEPIAATADDPIAPYVPIADPDAALGGPPPPPPAAADRRSPIPWLIAAAVLIMAAAIALALWQPWAGGDEAPTTPAPTMTETPTIPPIETPTEEPTSAPKPTQAPAPAPPPAPTQAPEPDPAPTEVTPEPTPSPSTSTPAPESPTTP